MILAAVAAGAKSYEVKSPDGRLSLKVDCGTQSTWTLSVDGVAVTEGNRLGMGAGYYDRYLPLCKNAYRAALAFDAQRTDAVFLPAEWDQVMDAVITDKEIY